MSLYDRDWYWAAVRERDGVEPKLNLGYVVPKASRPWHPVLSILLCAVICAGVLVLLYLFKH